MDCSSIYYYLYIYAYSCCHSDAYYLLLSTLDSYSLYHSSYTSRYGMAYIYMPWYFTWNRDHHLVIELPHPLG